MALCHCEWTFVDGLIELPCSHIQLESVDECCESDELVKRSECFYDVHVNLSMEHLSLACFFVGIFN